MSFGTVLHALQEAWHQELFVVDGNAIRLSTLLAALALVTLGYLASRWASRGIRSLLVGQLGLDDGGAAAVETLGFYLLFALAVITGLRLVHFPLTAFTLLGGALAIGIGFGSQNVMNNFISGLIIMLERPIRNGDLVEVEDTYGHVEYIGARSTRIRASDNTQIIVPNSFFLESNLLNFTLSDDVLRSQVNVGIVYGSPTREAVRLIERALHEHRAVLRVPAPRIIFADFGDNALLFEVYFWQHARTILDRRAVESDLRFRIDDLFREANIVIAFPQRDVHLDAPRPIDVRVIGADEAPGAR